MQYCSISHTSTIQLKYHVYVIIWYIAQLHKPTRYQHFEECDDSLPMYVHVFGYNHYTQLNNGLRTFQQWALTALTMVLK